jgi:hypothetical protein
VIYAFELASPLRKGFGRDKVFSSQINKICEQMPLDPEISKMDTVVLSSKDLKGLNRGKVQTALLTKNPNVTFIYIWSKKGEEDLIDTPFKVELKKVTPDSLYSAVNEIISDTLIKSGRLNADDSDSSIAIPKPLKPKFKASQFGRKDIEETEEAEEVVIKIDPITGLHYYNDDITDEMIYCDETGRQLTPAEIQIAKDKIAMERKGEEKEENGSDDSDDDFEDIDIDLDADEESKDKLKPATINLIKDAMAPEEEVAEEVPAPIAVDKSTELKNEIESIKSFNNWGALNDALQETSIFAELIANDADYNGTIKVLESLEVQMLDIMQNPRLTADEKFDKLLDLGRDKTTTKGIANSLMVDKVISIIHNLSAEVGSIAKTIVNKNYKAIDAAAAVDRIVLDDTANNEVIDAAVKAEISLLNTKKEISSLYSVMNKTVQDTTKNLTSGLPSENELINQIIGMSDEYFTPKNTKDLFHRMLEALEENKNTFVQADESVNKLLDKLNDVAIKYREVIKYQSERILLLKANRVEDIVIMDTALKPTMQLFVGESGSGVTSTVLARAGVIARGAKNVVIIDLSRKAKFEDYGIEAETWENFSESRINREFLCVKAPEIIDIDEILSHLKTRLDNYGSINIILSPEMISEAAMLAGDSLTLNFISDCTPRNMVVMQEAIGALSSISNIARKVVLVNPVQDPISCCRTLGVELGNTKLITIPYLPEMKECLVNKTQPAMYPEIRGAYSHF